MLNGRLGIVVGDVTGHGVGPAMLMSETRAYLRLLSTRREDLGKSEPGQYSLGRRPGRERYITLFLARIDPRARTLVYANAGHPRLT